MTYLQRLREDINNIVRSYGYEGELVDMLIDALSYYVSEHLVHLAGQYYNSSVFKTKNEDAALQLSLDHSVPIYRGENATVLLEIQATGPITFSPLQEVYSIGANYFYVKARRYIQLDTGSRYILELSYADQQANIIEYTLNLDTAASAVVLDESTNNDPAGKRNFINDFYILDDRLPISEDVALYALYSKAGVNHILFLPHTRLPHEFYFFTKNLHNISANSVNSEDIARNTQYPVLILTTPRFGLNIRINVKYLLNVIANHMRLRLVYLNYTAKIPSDDVLSSLIDYVNANMPVAPSATRIVDIISSRPPHDMNNIRYMVAEGSRYNGVIRSVSDIKHWFVRQSKARMYDAALITVQQASNSGSVYQLSVKYMLLYIPVTGVDPNEIQDFIRSHAAYIYASLPTFKTMAAVSNFNVAMPDTTYIVNWVPAGVNNSNNLASQCPNNSCFDLLLKEMQPLTVTITASYIGNNNVGVVQDAFRKALAKYVKRILHKVSPLEIFTIFSKLDHVSAVVSFTVEVPLLSNTPFFTLGGGATAQDITLVNLNSNNLIAQDYYYINDFDLSGITLAFST